MAGTFEIFNAAFYRWFMSDIKIHDVYREPVYKDILTVIVEPIGKVVEIHSEQEGRCRMLVSDLISGCIKIDQGANVPALKPINKKGSK